MRILNRPMFRYGGPIKEGIMHGMKNGGRAAALVGNPVYPKTDGREHHFWNFALQGAARALPYAAKALKYIKPTSIPRNIVTKSKSTLPIGMRGTIGSRTTTTPRSNWQMSKEWMKANPGWALTGGLSAYNAPGTYGAVKGAGGLGWKAVKQAADLAVPDWIWDQDKWEKERAEKMKPPTDIIKPGGFKKIIEEEKKITKTTEELAAEAKAARTKKLNKYLDTMGYDKAKKTAMGDALIDASAIVQGATDEAGSLKKADWGKMINQAIQSTSKRLDKPEQIREAVGLMLTKSEIEKDLEDPQVKRLRALQIEDAEEKLNRGFEKDMREFILARKEAPDKNQLERFARLTADEYELDFKKVTAKELEAIPEGASQEEIISQVVTGDGIYMIGDAIVRVTDGIPKHIG